VRGKSSGSFVEAIELPPHALLREARVDFPGIGGSVHSPGYDGSKATVALVPTVSEMPHSRRVAEARPPLRVEILVVRIFEPSLGSLYAIVPEKDANRCSIRRHTPLQLHRVLSKPTPKSAKASVFVHDLAIDHSSISHPVRHLSVAGSSDARFGSHKGAKARRGGAAASLASGSAVPPPLLPPQRSNYGDSAPLEPAKRRTQELSALRP
jgi:hypothetical protein